MKGLNDFQSVFGDINDFPLRKVHLASQPLSDHPLVRLASTDHLCWERSQRKTLWGALGRRCLYEVSDLVPGPITFTRSAGTWHLNPFELSSPIKLPFMLLVLGDNSIFLAMVFPYVRGIVVFFRFEKLHAEFCLV